MAPPDRLPVGTPGHHPRRARCPVRAVRQRGAGLRPGVNWIPDDVFPTRVTRERLAHRFDQAEAANVNLLRVWGGGRYESEDFYDLADERGLLVQQDFLFACAAYPEEEPFATEVAAEATEQVIRLAPHPSLVLWTGNNENIWGWHDWDWQAPLAGRSWGRGYYLDLLPGILAALDPTRPYWPGSPWSGSEKIHPNHPAYGTTHIWDVWNTDDYVKYREYLPRFVAEFGYQGPPAYATLRRALSDDPLAPDSPGMAHHQKAADGDRKLRRGLDAHLPEPRDFDDWHWLTQLNQARAIALGVEHFRSHRGRCMGTILWQLNDCWPVTSWAAIDGDGRRKPLWYALRHAYADRLLTVQPRDSGLALVAVNDGGQPWRASATVVRITLTGEPRAKTTLELDVPAHSAVTVALPDELARPDAAADELLVADTGDPTGRALWFFAEDRDVRWPAAAFDATVEPTDDGQRVRVTARTILRDVTLYPDRLDPSAEVDAALVTLLPGESATFTVRSATPSIPPPSPLGRCCAASTTCDTTTERKADEKETGRRTAGRGRPAGHRRCRAGGGGTPTGPGGRCTPRVWWWPRPRPVPRPVRCRVPGWPATAPRGSWSVGATGCSSTASRSGSPGRTTTT
ncbi:hypothetical protein GCM10029963_31660 [Micromonospora andamanensis]